MGKIRFSYLGEKHILKFKGGRERICFCTKTTFICL